jgi:hypothetical protein
MTTSRGWDITSERVSRQWASGPSLDGRKLTDARAWRGCDLAGFDQLLEDDEILEVR